MGIISLLTPPLLNLPSGGYFVNRRGKFPSFLKGMSLLQVVDLWNGRGHCCCKDWKTLAGFKSMVCRIILEDLIMRYIALDRQPDSPVFLTFGFGRRHGAKSKTPIN